MRKYLFLISTKFLAVMFATAIVVGCSPDNKFEATDDTVDDMTKYTATYCIEEISSDLFDLGEFTLSFKDEDGNTESMDISADNIPGYVSVQNVSSDFVIDFDMQFTRKNGVDLSNASYDIAINVYCIVELNGSAFYVEEPVIDMSETVSNSEIETILDLIESTDYRVTGAAGSY